MSVDPDDKTPLAIKKHRSADGFLWCTGTSGSHVPVVLLPGKDPNRRTSGVCDVCKTDDFLIWHCPVCWQMMRSQQRNWQRWERAVCA